MLLGKTIEFIETTRRDAIVAMTFLPTSQYHHIAYGRYNFGVWSNVTENN